MKKRFWCARCSKFHDGEPVNIDKLLEKAAQDLADAIDNEILEELKKWNSNSKSSPPTTG